MNAVRHWLNRHQLALVITGLLWTLLVLNVLPPHACCVELQGWINALTKTAFGIAGILAFALLLNMGTPGWLTLFFVSAIVGVVIEAIWVRRPILRLLIIFAIIVNSLVGCGLVVISPTLIDPGIVVCEHRASNANRVRIVAHAEQGGIFPGTFLFFLTSTDEGQSWTQVLPYRYDDALVYLHPKACDRVKSVDSQTIWLWIGHQIAVTHDGGHSWHIWPEESMQNPDCCWWSVKEVKFIDALHGMMTLDTLSDGPLRSYITEDGGLTWLEVSQ